MADYSIRLVRRLAVVRSGTQELAGVISLADISRAHDAESAAVALDGVSEPGGEHSQTQETSEATPA